MSVLSAYSAEDLVESDDPLLEEVVTTATKKGAAEAASLVVGSVSVLSSERLEERPATDIEDLGFELPNVAFDGIGTGKGIANFSIRGMGVAGSIPSIDPTVGVFVDGMYLGMNYGVITDMLDLESVEVLRGPQGLLFGRNVTGGAVLLRAKRPSGRKSVSSSLRLETGLEKRFTGALESPLSDGGVNTRLAVSYRDDSGWFTNSAPGGGNAGGEKSWVIRPVLTMQPTPEFDVTVLVESGNSDGDGPATQNRFQYSGFDFAIDEPGYSQVSWRHGIVEANRRLASGTITNLFGVRAVEHESLADIDSTVEPIFHLLAFTDQTQFSNELRYSGWIRNGWEIVTGLYLFGQTIRYREQRVIRNALGTPFGGDQLHRTAGAFISNDFDLSEHWVASAGVRYTVETKAVDVATNGVESCAGIRGACDFDFIDDDMWENVTPRLALQRWIGSRSQIYGQWTRGFRSGGYNLRNTSRSALPGPFDEEVQDAYEIRFKTESSNFRANFSLFRNHVHGLQRQVTTADVATGGIQVTANTADATIQGIEAELDRAFGESLTVRSFVGYIHGAYDRVRYDLDGDGTTVGDDTLQLPRLAPLTFGVSVQYRHSFTELGQLTARVGLSRRDDSEILDDNSGVLDGGEMLDASVAISPNDNLQIKLFGRNLLNQTFRRSDFDLTGLVDSRYSPLKEGRVLGVTISWNRLN